MIRLHADADRTRWVPVTGSFGLSGRRHRKAAIRMLLTQAGSAFGSAQRPGSGLLAWSLSQATPYLMRRAGGRVLAWVWKADPELIAVMAQLQEATSQVRAARAMMPMEYDDTESFHSPFLGAGEKLAVPLPVSMPDSSAGRMPPFATYTWDTGTHVVTITAICGDPERFGTVIDAVDELARTVRIDDDLTIGESPAVLRIEPPR